MPAVNQVETHPFQQQIATQQFLREQGVQMESWGPFAEGKNDMFTNEVLHTIAQKHDRSVAQVIVRWLTQRDVVAIPKSVRPDRMAENFAISTSNSARMTWPPSPRWTPERACSSIIATRPS